MSAITSTPNNQVVTFQKSPITFVPRDVMLLIFKQYFGAADMAALSRVCRTWNTYANDAGLWNLLLMRAFPNAGKASINPKQTYKELVTCSNMEKEYLPQSTLYSTTILLSVFLPTAMRIFSSVLSTWIQIEPQCKFGILRVKNL